jgi:hypothetical protein
MEVCAHLPGTSYVNPDNDVADTTAVLEAFARVNARDNPDIKMKRRLLFNLLIVCREFVIDNRRIHPIDLL